MAYVYRWYISPDHQWSPFSGQASHTRYESDQSVSSSKVCEIGIESLYLENLLYRNSSSGIVAVALGSEDEEWEMGRGEEGGVRREVEPRRPF